MSAAQVDLRPSEPLVKRRWGRTVLALVTVLVTALGLGMGWRWLSAPERFPLKSVRVEGAPVKVVEAELRRVIGPHLHAGMLDLDLGRIRRAVETLPWVERAGVRRRWPGSLQISIEERSAVAHWGEQALLNGAGLIFAPAPASFPEGLPTLSGPEGSEQAVLARYRRLDELFAGAGLQLRELHLDGRRAWRAVTADKVVVQLGIGDDDHAAERFVRAFTKITVPADVRLARVDLRYPNGFAVAWEKQAAALR